MNILYAVFVSDAFSDGRMFLHISFVLVALLPRNFKLHFPKNILLLFMLLALIKPAYNAVKHSLRKDIPTPLSDTAQHYLLTKWINSNLLPEKGSIGLCYLGAGFHLNCFEIADFLGKADEGIANTPVKWGPPGHNKWDVTKTLEKWKPQAIIFPEDPEAPGNQERYARILQERKNFAFWADIGSNAFIRKNFVWHKPISEISFGLLLRK